MGVSDLRVMTKLSQLYYFHPRLRKRDESTCPLNLSPKTVFFCLFFCCLLVCFVFFPTKVVTWLKFGASSFWQDRKAQTFGMYCVSHSWE